MENPQIILGLCCINNHLQKTQNVRSRIIQRAKYTSESAIEKAKENLEDLLKLMDENIRNNIKSFRISSTILPRYTDTQVESYDMEIFQDYFEEIGTKAIENNIRLSFHPDQFVVLSSSDPKVVENSLRDLEYHCEMLHRMGIPKRLGVCNIHVGGVYEPKYNKEHDSLHKKNTRHCCKRDILDIWCKNYDKLSDIAKQYITVENDEKSFNLNDCLNLSEKCGVPVVYDTHHEECYILLHPKEEHIPVEENLDRLVKSWVDQDRIPMAHVSNQAIDKRIGAHSDYIDRLPDIIYTYAEKCPNKILYLDVEAKAKEEALYTMRTKFDYLY